MQNNNSKLNTILLVVVIILLGVGVWGVFQLSGDKTMQPLNDQEDQTFTSYQDEKEDTSDQEAVTYQYPSSGPAFIEFEVKGEPAVSYETTPTRTVFSGGLGVDKIWYLPGLSQGSDPCYSPFTDIFYSGQLTFGTKVYNVCSNKGYTYFIQDGFEGTAAIVQTSGENQTAPHYVDPATLTFAMEGEG